MGFYHPEGFPVYKHHSSTRMGPTYSVPKGRMNKSINQIKMRFSLIYKKTNVDCLSTLKFVFFVVYNFKLLTKIQNSTKKRLLLRFNFLSFDC